MKDKTERTKERHAKARARWALAKAVASFPGSLNEKRSFVIRAMAAGLIDQRPVPARETIRELVAKWERGEQAVEDYYDAPRSGRPRVILPDAFERDIRYTLEAGKGVTAHALTETLQAVAREKGLPSPTYKTVHRRFADAGRVVRAAARHGARAGEIDGFPHAKVATRFAHDAWALDELTAPVFVRIFDDVADCWVSARSDVIPVIDVFSGACVGYHVVDPSRRRDEWGIQFRSGFDKDDVLAALFSAACPELATDATRHFAGYLPDRLRWDNATQHRSIMLMLHDAGVELDVRPIRKRRAASNGAVERRVAILKSRCAGIFGHVDEYIPTDGIDNDGAADLPGQRTVASGYTDERMTRRIPVRPEDLLTVEEFRAEFERVVQRYNHEVRNRMHGQTPRARYETGRKPRRPRNGHMFVRVMAPRTVAVGRYGIQHADGGRTHTFNPIIDGHLVMIDQPVTYHPDPLARGIFVVRENRLSFLLPQTDYSDEVAARLAKNHTAVARLLSDNAGRIRWADLAKRVGAAGAEATFNEYNDRVQEYKDRKANGDDSDPVPPTARAGGGVQHPEAPENDPWESDDVQRFIRPAEEHDDNPNGD
jgi:transposase InsO family protein